MIRTLIKGLVALSLLVCGTTIHAQINQGGNPVTFENEKINWHFPTIETDAFDLEEMLAEDEINNQFKDQPYRFGKNFVMGKNLSNAGNWHDLPNGDRVWLLGISSPGAVSINLSFDQFDLPEGGRLFIYSPDYEHVLGAYTSENNNNNEGFGTYPIPGEYVVVEYFEPAEQQGNTLLQIETVTHAYRDVEKAARDVGDSGTCNNNVVCAVGNPWENEINSVAMIVVNGNGICTGAMVNNTASDGHPYFLTANHCLGGSVANWVFRFNWQSTTCAGNNVGAFDTVGGPTLLASNAGTDFALLEINNGNPIPTAYNPFYSGWDATGVTPSSQVGIHHPSGDLKKISFDNQAAGTATFGGAICWRIFDWEDGTTEPGSSGSPLFDQNHRIIGQLYGGEASCANNINDYYGKFDATYPNVCNWLAPGCNTLVLDGYDPLSPTVANDVQLQSIGEPSGAYCAGSVTPEFTVRNAGSATLTSFSYTYDVDGASPVTIVWTGSLASSASTTISLGSIAVADGAHSFNVSASNPNGVADENPANNDASSSFSTISSGITVDLTFLTDNYPGENTWEIVDDQGTIVLSGGPYGGTQTTYNVSACLDAGCYDFNVYDSFGDGMQYQGVVGNYTLVDDQGNVLAQMVAGGNFGASANHPFCLTSSTVLGCTDPTACNYNAAATDDDGSCDLPDGCTDNTACNFDPAASCDDGSCTYGSVYYVDGDDDGFGAGAPVTLCAPQAGYADNDLDCDDTNNTMYPNAPSTQTGIDNDCNGTVDTDEEVPMCMGDMNDDGQRDVADLLVVLGDFGCLNNCVADFDGDGVSNSSDFLVFLTVFGLACP
ncbi:MAG: trypsin-like peptidase domain-containing protein [Flavobacteriales bacterium]|nr:trypsin-like peptidase domain-containing protein [Flavobacteriales bacterium]